MYFDGGEVRQDEAEAVKWIRQATDMGEAQAKKRTEDAGKRGSECR
jgi:TPR repeat protein